MLTANLHSSGRANGPVLRLFPEGERRQRSRCDLWSAGTNNLASWLAELLPPADQRTGPPVLPLFPSRPLAAESFLSLVVQSSEPLPAAGGMTIVHHLKTRNKHICFGRTGFSGGWLTVFRLNRMGHSATSSQK
jgi:hypothetical protein